MDILKTKQFQRSLKKSTLLDSDLISACQEMCDGLIDADYGGLLFKKRIAKPGQGKSGSYRSMIGARLGKRFVFVYLFDKNARDNINASEEKALKQLVRLYLNADDAWLREQIVNKLLFKIEINEVDHE